MDYASRLDDDTFQLKNGAAERWEGLLKEFIRNGSPRRLVRNSSSRSLLNRSLVGLITLAAVDGLGLGWLATTTISENMSTPPRRRPPILMAP